MGFTKIWSIVNKTIATRAMLNSYPFKMRQKDKNMRIENIFNRVFILFLPSDSFICSNNYLIEIESHDFSNSSLGLSPISVRTRRLLYDLFRIVKSTGVNPFESGSEILTPCFANYAITYGSSL